MENDVVTNDQMMNDFFSDADGLIDQDTGADVSYPVAGDPFSQQSQQQKPNQQQSVPNAQIAKTQQQQQVQQPIPSQTQQQQVPNAQQQQQAQQPAGFEQQFFKTDDKGNQLFDTDAALNFLMPQNDASFKYDTPNYRQMTQQVQQPQQPQEPEKPVWQREIEELQKIETNYRTNLSIGLNFLQEALNQGVQLPQAMEYANQKLNSLIAPEIKRLEYEQRAKREEEFANKQKEAEAMQQLQPRAETNLLKHYTTLGGQEKFNQLIFGTEVNGKLVGGFGTDIINQLFDHAYEGKKMPQGAELHKAYNDFWTKLCANPNRLQFVVDVAQSRLQKTIFPHIVNNVRSVKEAQMQQQQRAQTARPSPIQNNSGQAGELDALDNYFGSKSHMSDAFDTV